MPISFHIILTCCHYSSSTTAKTIETNMPKNRSRSNKNDVDEIDYVIEMKDKSEEEEEEKESTHDVYILDGVEYSNYSDLVTAKRERNQKKLTDLGFTDKKGKEKHDKVKNKSLKPLSACTEW